MPSIKLDIDVDELEEAEYSPDEEFVSYSGEIPPVNAIIKGYVKTIWLTADKNDNDMLKILFEAAENEGEDKEFDGCPYWENMSLTPGSKFKWKPFIDFFGISLRDLKTKMVAESDEEERNGLKLKKIGQFVIGADSDDAWCRVVTARERYNGEWQARIGKWLPWEDAEADDEDEGEPEEVDAEIEDAEDAEDAEIEEEEAEEDAEEEEADADEEPEPTPARGRRSAAKPAGRSTTAKAAPKAAATKAKAPARGARTATRATSKVAPAKAAPARGRGRRGAADDVDEPPF